MRVWGWCRLAAAAATTATLYVQRALLLLSTSPIVAPAGDPVPAAEDNSARVSNAHQILPTQDGSAHVSSTDHQTLPSQESSGSGTHDSSSSGGGGGHSTSGRLAVVVPVWKGDVDRALAAVARWPRVCSAVTLSNVELVLYKAEGEGESEVNLLDGFERTAGRCFAKTKVVYAHLREQDNFYPKGPSVQFYKIFLDESVRAHFSEFDAISIIEWDVTVAHDTSFERLYHAAFGGGEPFWVKGSVLAGGSFHKTASDSEMWHVLGHINGNAIYNNNDPAWFEFVEYTQTRWEYQYAYDVALWATISDFPYSWPLWQRYSSKFVSTNLIANVPFENVDAGTVNTAIAGETLFIHGRSIEGGSASLLARRNLKAEEPSQPEVWCEPSCGDADAVTTGEFPAGVSTTCDASCGVGGRFGGYLCGAGDSRRFGGSCRLCYTDQEIALSAEEGLRRSREFSGGDGEARHVVMCDTMRPPAALECSPKCAEKKDTVCDSTCGTGRHGDYNCGWRGHGSTCRYCFEDTNTARLADEVAKRRGGRVVMCDTHEPPREEPVSDPNASVFAAGESRKLVLGKEDLKKKDKSVQNSSSGCQSGCKSSEGVIRVCDSGCSDDDPLYDTQGCGDNTFGEDCRTCYTSMATAKNVESSGNEAVMCDTLEYASADASFSPTGYSRQHQTGYGRQQNRGGLSDVHSTKNGCDPDYCRSSEGVIRVCDSVCSDDDTLYDTRGCGDNTFGEDCRTCYTSMATAKDAESFGNEAVMCDTLEYASADASFGQTGSDRQQKRRRLSDVRSTNNGCDLDCETTETAATGNVCDPECSDPTSTSPYGALGCGDSGLGVNCRACYYTPPPVRRDASLHINTVLCEDLVPLGARELGQSFLRQQPGATEEALNQVQASTGATRPVFSEPLGTHVRGQQPDSDKALGQVSTTSGAPRPVLPEGKGSSSSGGKDSSSGGKGGSGSGGKSSSGSGGKGSSGSGGGEEEFGELAAMPFEGDVARGNLCAFVSSSAQVIGDTDATVRSVLTFMPGMRTAIAVSDNDFHIFDRTFGHLPGVKVSSSSNANHSALFADKHCGAEAQLIYYMNSGSLLSRSFTSKDTHSPRGELLVAYSDGKVADYASRASARASSILLGFASPVFTFGTDLILPSFVNDELRNLLLPLLLDDESEARTASIGWRDDERAVEILDEVKDISAPEVLAAWAYSRNPEGIWFVNPQKWVSQHLFQAVSIWNIPLIKPAFSCSVDPSLRLADYHLSFQLMRQLDAMVAGETCRSGFMTIDPRTVDRIAPL